MISYILVVSFCTVTNWLRLTSAVSSGARLYRSYLFLGNYRRAQPYKRLKIDQPSPMLAAYTKAF